MKLFILVDLFIVYRVGGEYELDVGYSDIDLFFNLVYLFLGSIESNIWGECIKLRSELMLLWFMFSLCFLFVLWIVDGFIKMNGFNWWYIYKL